MMKISVQIHSKILLRSLKRKKKVKNNLKERKRKKRKNLNKKTWISKNIY